MPTACFIYCVCHSANIGKAQQCTTSPHTPLCLAPQTLLKFIMLNTNSVILTIKRFWNIIENKHIEQKVEAFKWGYKLFWIWLDYISFVFYCFIFYYCIFVFTVSPFLAKQFLLISVLNLFSLNFLHLPITQLYAV